MKRIALLLISTIVVAASSAQTRPISLDLSTNFSKEQIIKAKYKDTLVILLTSINRKLYKVETNETKTEFNIAVPSALSGIKLPGFLNLSLPPVSDPGAQLVATKEVNDVVDNFNTRIQELFASIERRAKKLDSCVLLNNELLRTFKDCSLSPANINNALTSEIVQYLGLPVLANGYTITALRQHLADTLMGSYPNAQSELIELQRIQPIYLALAKNDFSTARSVMEDSLAAYEERLKSTRLSPQGRRNIISSISDSKSQLRSINLAAEVSARQEALLKEQLKEAKELVNEMYKFVKEDKINNVLSLVDLMANPANFMFVSDTIVAKKDEIRYKLSVTPQELNACGSPEKRTAEVVIKTKGGLKIDFSTGAFVLGGSDKFLGESYYWENIDATNRKIVKAKRDGRLQLGIGALAHFYMRSYCAVKPAISLGVSTTSGFDDLNFHAGPSLILGNKSRVILSGGVALKSTKVLDRNLNTDVSYAKEYSPDDIPTISQFPVAGWFFSATFNFSSLKGN